MNAVRRGRMRWKLDNMGNDIAAMEAISKESRRVSRGDVNLDPDDVAGEVTLRWVELGMPDVPSSYFRKMAVQVAAKQRAENMQQAYEPAYTPNSTRALLKKYPPPETRKDLADCIQKLKESDRLIIVEAYGVGYPTHPSQQRAVRRAVDRLTLHMNMHGYGHRRKAKTNAASMAAIEDDYER